MSINLGMPHSLCQATEPVNSLLQLRRVGPDVSREDDHLMWVVEVYKEQLSERGPALPLFSSALIDTSHSA